ncbi:MAG: HAMP domain-containing histidine kinase [Ferrovum sp.]|nr:HAMP domain-containing histidine kinase [Ferrovum sp.]
MYLFNISLRYKLPLWGGFLVVVSVLAVSTALLVNAYDDLQQGVHVGAEVTANTLCRTLFPALLHNDDWRAFEQINAAMASHGTGNPVQLEAIFVTNGEGRIVVSSDPLKFPMLARLDALGRDYARLAAPLVRMAGDKPARRLDFANKNTSYSIVDSKQVNETRQLPDFADAKSLFFAQPIRQEGAQVGVLVLSYSKDVFWPRFQNLALQGSLIGALILAVLLPLNWYWGRRMAGPLVNLARRMGVVAQGDQDIQTDQTGATYPYRDEIGQLFEAYDAMVLEMRGKAKLEQELLQAKRLTAIGRLASGIAHEVNNPLGGMLMALDTLKTRGELPTHVNKTLNMLERGLRQIEDIVAALLVQTKDQGRHLKQDDLEDIRTLIQPQVLAKSQKLSWVVNFSGKVQLPAAACRQLLINLLLNAVQATAEKGRIGLAVDLVNDGLRLVVVNEAAPIPKEFMDQLFEPFVGGREGGHGLGLWVTYQIVKQLTGQINVSCDNGEVRFDVWLPLEKQ